MQDIFQQFISFLLDSWKSLIFLFVFSFVLKETIERTFLKTIRFVTHLIIDYSDKTVSLFYNKEWKADNHKENFDDITWYISLGKMKNEKIYLK